MLPINVNDGEILVAVRNYTCALFTEGLLLLGLPLSSVIYPRLPGKKGSAGRSCHLVLGLNHFCFFAAHFRLKKKVVPLRMLDGINPVSEGERMQINI